MKVYSFFIDGKRIAAVEEFPHLGHIITSTLDEKSDILAKRNSLCRNINNVLCYFNKCDPFVKLKLVRSYCSDFYGSVLWKMSHNTTDSICVAWRKGLRRTLSLPFCTHSRLVAPICDFLPLRDELICRCASFISKCLFSDNGVVRAVARNGVYFMRMLSPVGVNSQFCCDYYGLPLLNIHAVCKNLAWSAFRQSVLPESDRISTIKELLGVKFGFMSLPLFDAKQLDCMSDSLCTD